jgi:catechol 2,3-dioxygenase-like lactoylglutathione lyase family enzyme
MSRGFSHVSLSTLDMDATYDFYINVLGFKPLRFDRIPVDEGGLLRHLFIDVGHHQMLAFLGAEGVETIPGPTDPGMNVGLGVPRTFYHFAFEMGSEPILEAKRQELEAKGVPVSKQLVDLEWVRSFSLYDPVNGISLEFCCQVRELTPEDAIEKVRFTTDRARLDMRGVDNTRYDLHARQLDKV